MRPLKIFILGLILAFNSDGYSQTTTNKNEKKSNGVFISAGTHVAMFHVFGASMPPAQGQIDVKVDRRFFIGAGYSFDQFNFDDLGTYFGRNYSYRHNARLRLFSYFGDYNKPIMGYAGGAVGASLWLDQQNQPHQAPIIPTVQLFVGMKTKIYKRFFNLSEFAIGAPYLLQTSFGFEL